jgi:hypothetical protein
MEKMRGLAMDNQPRPYQISDKGVEVFPKATVYKQNLQSINSP